MLAMLKTLLPLASSWAQEQESIILRQGVPLTNSLLEDAKRLRIAQPQRVRLRAAEQIPMPLHPMLRDVAEKVGLLSSLTIGLTLRYGIVIRSDCWGDRRLVVHELAHVAQYERFGSFRAF